MNIQELGNVIYNTRKNLKLPQSSLVMEYVHNRQSV